MNIKMHCLIIIEPYQHQEILRRWLPLLLELFPEVQCWLSSEDLLLEFPEDITSHERFSYISPSQNQELDPWLKDKMVSIQPSDHVLWLTTGLRYDRLLWLPEETRLFIVVHNVQSTLNPRLSWKSVGSALPSLLKYISTRQFRGRRKLLGRRPTLLFPTLGLAQYAAALGYPEHALAVCPFAYSAVDSSVRIDERINIVVPGSVKPQQRNYDELKQIIASWTSETKLPARLIFLGSCKDRVFHNDWTRFALQMPDLELGVFSGTVTDGVYDYWAKHTDVFLLPIKEQLSFGPFREQMGKSKVSGGVYDALYYNKPLLIPHFYSEENLPAGLLIARYRNVKEGAEQLKNILAKASITRPIGNGREQLKEQMYLTLCTARPMHDK